MPRTATLTEVMAAADEIPSLEQTARALLANPNHAALPGDIALQRALTAKTIRNHFSALVKSGRARYLDDGRCQLTHSTLSEA